MAADEKSVAFVIRLKLNQEILTRNDDMKTGQKPTLIISLLAAFFLLCCHDDNLNRAEIVKALDAISQYQPGMSLEPMIRLDSLLRKVKDPASMQIVEREILARMESNVTAAGKQQFCRRLHVIGSAHSTPVLLNMLSDTVMFDMALYALEMIPDEQIDDALWQMLKTGADGRLPALINISGKRVIEKAIPDLAVLIDHPRPEISAAAVNALLGMPPEKTIDIFLHAITNPPGHLRDRLYDALLNTAGKLKDHTKSMQIMTDFYNGDYPAHFRINALRRIVRIDDKKGAELILNAVKGDQPSLRAGALVVTDALPESDILAEIISYTGNLGPYEQILLVEAVGHRNENNYPEILKKFAVSDYPSVRYTALKNLAETGDPESVLFLATRAARSDGEEKNMARESLYLLSGSGIDERIIEAIPDANPNVQYELIRSAGARMITGSSNLLLKYASVSDQKIREAALQSLRRVAGTEDYPALLDLLLQSKTGQEEKLLFACLDDVMRRMDESETKGREALSRFEKIDDPHKRSVFLELLGMTGAADALPLLIDAAGTGDDYLQEHAIRGLSRWPDGKPLALLADLTVTAESKKNRILAFRGYLEILSSASDLSAESVTDLFSKAFELAPDPAEKKRVFSAITKNPGFQAIDLLVPYLDEPQFKSEAETAILTIGWQIIDVDNNRLRPVIQQVLNGTGSGTIRKQSQNLLKEIG